MKTRVALRTLLAALVLTVAVSLAASAQDPVFPYPPAPPPDDASAAVLEQVDAATARREHAQEELEGLGARRSEARTRLRARIGVLYRLSRAGALPASGGLPALLAHLGRQERLARVVSREAQSVDALRRRGDELRIEVATSTAEAERARGELAAIEARRMPLELPVLPLPDDATGGTIVDGAGMITYGPSSDSPTYGTIRVVDDGAPPEAFSTMRGTLELPVAGDMRVEDLDGHAVSLLAQPGAAVRAVAEGRIVFADEHESWGKLVVVDHGSRYFTVYGGLSSADVHAGDRIPRGARLGTLGTHPLRFEVRRGAQPLVARDWLGI